MMGTWGSLYSFCRYLKFSIVKPFPEGIKSKEIGKYLVKSISECKNNNAPGLIYTKLKYIGTVKYKWDGGRWKLLMVPFIL